MVKSNTVYSPQAYIEMHTKLCYSIKANPRGTAAEIRRILKMHGLNKQSFPLKKIGYAMENGIDVVLVDVSYFNKDGAWIEKFEWFEV